MATAANEYKSITTACFVGIVVQAILNNLTAILFVPMMEMYGLSYIHLGILVGTNFTAQIVSDIAFSGWIDRIGFRRLMIPTCLASFLGLVFFGMSPWLLSSPFTGLLVATILFSVASGLLDVLLSPIINAVPNDHKGSSMSLLHSFYAWGQVGAIIVTTLFLFLFKAKNWQYIVFFWALMPLLAFFLFVRSKFPACVPAQHRKSLKDLFRNSMLILAVVAIFFGAASEIIMNQFASSFMEKAVLLPKLTGDLLGMTGFAVMLGFGRLYISRKVHTVSIHTILVYTSLLAVLCYLAVALSPFIGVTVLFCALTGFAASMLWPGTLIATSDHFPLAGSWIFALLAAAGDIGAAFGPWVTSYVVDHSFSGKMVSLFMKIYQITTEQAALRIGILFATIFPVMTFMINIIFKKAKYRAGMIRGSSVVADK